MPKINQSSVPRILTGVVAAAFLGALISGCGGGASTPIPQSVQNHNPAPTTQKIKVMKLSRATIPFVMSKLIRSGAFASPIKGQHLKAPRSIKPLTVSQGLDLANNGGPVMAGATIYNILVNCADESCWGGQIGQFENDLFGSNMIGILNQYTGGGSFSDGGDYSVQYNTSVQLSDQDISNIVYQVASQNNLQTGYGTMFNVFLGSGVQQCSQNAGGCYAQQYCAYHGSNDFSDIGHTLYSTEPYQDIQGCQVSSLPSPNGSTADSTASTASHEMFETFTDPVVAANNVAWYNQQGGEIGDLCAPATGVPTGIVQLGNETWEIQQEYSNNVHDCSFTQ